MRQNSSSEVVIANQEEKPFHWIKYAYRDRESYLLWQQVYKKQLGQTEGIKILPIK